MRCEHGKIYYVKSSGFVCYRYPDNLEPENENDYIEVSEEEADKTYQCPYGKIWKVIGGKLSLEDGDYSEEERAKIRKAENEGEVDRLKRYLESTDYIVLKMAECYGDDKALKAIKAEYSEELAERKKARARINELEASL